MCFVNTIGRIVQGCVHRWSGVANKNIGDAFVVLWKVPEMDLSNQKKNGNTAGATAADTVNKISETSDRALMGFVHQFPETPTTGRRRVQRLAAGDRDLRDGPATRAAGGEQT